MSRPRSPTLADDAARRPPRRLGSPAPATFADDVLVEVGLADRMAPIDSPLGTLWVAWNGRGVSEVEQAADGDRGRGPPRGAHRPPDDARRRPARSPRGRDRRAGSPARRASGSRSTSAAGREFEVAVWTKALEIPRGEVRPYGWIAAEIGRPKAVRAVGTALGHNPVPLIVPCHRVVRTDGTIGQYSLGGPGNKRTILAAEGLDPEALEDAARRGERLSGSTTTRIVVLADLPPRAAGPGPLPGLVPVAPRGARARATGRARCAARRRSRRPPDGCRRAARSQPSRNLA